MLAARSAGLVLLNASAPIMQLSAPQGEISVTDVFGNHQTTNAFEDVTGRAARGLRSVFCATALLWTLAARAAVAPLPINVPPNLGEFREGLSATQVNISGSANSSAPGPDNTLITANDSYSQLSRTFNCTTQPLDCNTDESAESRTAHAAVNGYLGESTSKGVATPGTLRASAVARVGRPDTNGLASAEATTMVSFTDVLFIGTNGDPELSDSRVSFIPRVGVTGSVFKNGEVPAGASYDTFLWIFPYAASQDFEVSAQFALLRNEMFYSALSNNTLNQPSQFEIGSLNNLNPGSAYWIHAVLRMSAGASLITPFGTALSGSAGADLSNTVHVFIDPSPVNPNATFSSASGASYLSPVTAVPLPSGLLLFGSAMMATLISNRRSSKGRRLSEASV